MKKTLLSLAAGAICLCQSATAEPVMVDITLQNDAQVRGYILAADGKSIKYSVDKSGAGSSTVNMDQIKFLQLFAPDAWTEAENNYRLGEFEKAEEQFKALAEEYAPIAALEDEIGALSKYYYLKTLKANGKLEVLNDEIDKMRAQPFALSSIYSEDAAWLVPWGLIGKSNWDGLLEFVARYTDTEAQGDNPIPPFKKTVPRHKLAELSYFRAKAIEEKGQANDAIKDYYRAITLNRGADRQITKEAMLALMNIIRNNENESSSLANRSELYTLTTFYQQAFGEGDLPSEYSGFLIPPPAE